MRKTIQATEPTLRRWLSESAVLLVWILSALFVPPWMVAAVTVQFVVQARWPDWSEGDVGAYVRQCLQFSLHGRMPPLAVHENGLRASWEGDEAEGRSLIEGAVRYANRNTAKMFPSLYREHGAIFGAVKVEGGGA